MGLTKQILIRSGDTQPVGATEARAATGLSCEVFACTRWALERVFWAESGTWHDLPLDVNVPLLTSSEVRRLNDGQRAVYLERKAARMAWTRENWLLVPVWGGFKRPRAEWRFDLARCELWGARSRGEGIQPILNAAGVA